VRAKVAALTENTGAALGTAGVVIAGGLALTQAKGMWVWVGIAVSAVATVLAVWALWVTVAASSKSRAFRDALGRALKDGEDLLGSEQLDDESAQSWGQSVYDLIDAGLGPSEAQLFLSDHDLGVMYSSGLGGTPKRFMHRRLQRLSRLLDRAHTLHVGPDFDAKRYVGSSR
jgi:hypothetical protein